MKHLVDQSTGTLVLIPESEPDKLLLFHLMNCMDLSQFSDYLEVQQRINPAEITTDLGVTGHECIEYTSKPIEPVHRSPDVTEKAISSGNLIGFNRDSY